MAYDDGTIGLHARIKIRMTKEIDGKPVRKLVSTTMGRVIFNGPIPQDLGFVDRSDPENDFKLEVDFLVNKKKLGEIIDRCIKIHGTSIAADMLDKIKAQGYKYSTRSVSPSLSATLPYRRARANSLPTREGRRRDHGQL